MVLIFAFVTEIIYLPICSRLGSAVGFRLKHLPKLADSKAADGKTTLLQVRLGKEIDGGAY